MEKIDKEKLIKKELSKLDKIFKDLPKDKQSMSEGLKKQAAFMYATLQDLQEQIDNEGVVELFVQGTQSMLREHPAAKIYNTMVKNYSSVCKQLLDMLPDDKNVKQTEDELVNFIKKVGA